jgi:PPOX class probable FMN-dependent enzyme
MSRFAQPVTTLEELRAVLSPPSAVVTEKETSTLDEFCRAFIARSPFVVVASTDGAGRVDVSPKGDPAGFVRVVDDRTLAIPERKGNHRADTFTNVLQHPGVGLIFLVPGVRNTLRVRGLATIVRDEELRESMAFRGRVPDLALVVEVTTAYFHCAKCVVRSGLWSVEADGSRPDDERLLAEAMVAHGNLPISVEQMQQIIVDDEVDRLY